MPTRATSPRPSADAQTKLIPPRRSKSSSNMRDGQGRMCEASTGALCPGLNNEARVVDVEEEQHTHADHRCYAV